MPEFYLGQWEAMSAANSPDGIPYWSNPGGDALASVDLRATAQRAATPISDDGLGLFVYEGTRNYPQLTRHLGNVLDGQLRTPELNAVKSLTGKNIASTRLDQVVLELFQVHGDPTGLTGWRPMRVNQHRRPITFAINGLLISEPWSDSNPAFANTIAIFQSNYRAAVLEGATDDLLRRWTGAELLKMFGRMADSDADVLMPSEYRSKGYQQPSTVITDDFTDSNVALESHTPSPTNWGSWEAVASTSMDVFGNACQSTNVNVWNRYRANNGGLSSDAMYGQFVVAEGAGTNYYGVCLRFAASADTWYECSYLDGGNAGSDGVRIRSWTTGTPSSIATSTPEALSQGLVVHAEITADDQYTLKYDGVTKLGPTTNTDITGNLYAGVTNWLSGSHRGSIDDWEAGDLVVAASLPPIRARMNPALLAR